MLRTAGSKVQSPGAKVMNKSDEFVAHVVAPPCAGTTAALTNSASAVKISIES